MVDQVQGRQVSTTRPHAAAAALFTDFLFRDEAEVGLSLITATLVLKPLVVALFWLCLKGYREGLAAQDALEHGSAA